MTDPSPDSEPGERHADRSGAAGTDAASACAPLAEPILPATTSDEGGLGWGEGDDSNDARLLAERPPHW